MPPKVPQGSRAAWDLEGIPGVFNCIGRTKRNRPFCATTCKKRLREPSDPPWGRTQKEGLELPGDVRTQGHGRYAWKGSSNEKRRRSRRASGDGGVQSGKSPG